ncbi:hypothetical protein AMECASPLE_034525 [Ameca splendens]|uniref:Uncharacterized protein n=1 Tax=Ameca splendens TaxID=208324 RepID=A0ABV0XWF4_9TELE
MCGGDCCHFFFLSFFLEMNIHLHAANPTLDLLGQKAKQHVGFPESSPAAAVFHLKAASWEICGKVELKSSGNVKASCLTAELHVSLHVSQQKAAALHLCVLQQHHLLSKPTNCSHQSFMFASGSVL